MANKRMLLGAFTEHYITSLLLKEERELYLPVVDDHGVDILVKSRKISKDPYQEIQVKSKDLDGQFSAISFKKTKANYWFVFYVKQQNIIWLINSLILKKIATPNKKGKNKGKYSIKLIDKKGVKYKNYIIDNFTSLP